VTAAILLLAPYYLAPSQMPYVRYIAFASTLIVPAVLLSITRTWRIVGFGFKGWQARGFFFLALIISSIFLFAGINFDQKDGLGYTLSIQFLNALGEEVLFRGLIFVILSQLNRSYALILGGFLFGSMHLLQGLMGAPWAGALQQALFTSLAGILFAAVRYRTNTIWTAVFLHLFLNLCIIYSRLPEVVDESTYFWIKRGVNLLEVAMGLIVIFSAKRMYSEKLLSRGRGVVSQPASAYAMEVL
jgi:membrane protease YdiL (CAAX protease family)